MLHKFECRQRTNEIQRCACEVDRPVGTVEHTSNCEFLLKIYHFPSFWKSLSATKLTYTPTLSAIYALTPYLIALVSMRTSRKTYFRL